MKKRKRDLSPLAFNSAGEAFSGDEQARSDDEAADDAGGAAAAAHSGSSSADSPEADFDRKRPRVHTPPSSPTPAAPTLPVRTSARVLRMKEERKVSESEETAPPCGPVSPPAAQPPSKPEQPAPRRTWGLWSSQDTTLFFHALRECGKNFDSIVNFMQAQSAGKKKGAPAENPNYKNREQVRQFYYRTWHNIRPLLEFPDVPLKCSTRELYGLINYGEMRLRLGITMIEKYADKLQELVLHGYTTVRVKGRKGYRVRTPICPALKTLHQYWQAGGPGGGGRRVGSGGGGSGGGAVNMPLLPTALWLLLNPLQSRDFRRVHMGSYKNPRVRLKVGLQTRLSAVIEHLQRKWALAEPPPFAVKAPTKLAASIVPDDGERELWLIVPDGVKLKKPGITSFEQATSETLSLSSLAAIIASQPKVKKKEKKQQHQTPKAEESASPETDSVTSADDPVKSDANEDAQKPEVSPLEEKEDEKAAEVVPSDAPVEEKEAEEEFKTSWNLASGAELTVGTLFLMTNKSDIELKYSWKEKAPVKLEDPKVTSIEQSDCLSDLISRLAAEELARKQQPKQPFSSPSASASGRAGSGAGASNRNKRSPSSTAAAAKCLSPSTSTFENGSDSKLPGSPLAVPLPQEEQPKQKQKQKQKQQQKPKVSPSPPPTPTLVLPTPPPPSLVLPTQSEFRRPIAPAPSSSIISAASSSSKNNKVVKQLNFVMPKSTNRRGRLSRSVVTRQIMPNRPLQPKGHINAGRMNVGYLTGEVTRVVQQPAQQVLQLQQQQLQQQQQAHQLQQQQQTQQLQQQQEQQTQQLQQMLQQQQIQQIQPMQQQQQHEQLLPSAAVRSNGQLVNIVDSNFQLSGGLALPASANNADSSQSQVIQPPIIVALPPDVASSSAVVVTTAVTAATAVDGAATPTSDSPMLNADAGLPQISIADSVPADEGMSELLALTESAQSVSPANKVSDDDHFLSSVCENSNSSLLQTPQRPSTPTSPSRGVADSSWNDLSLSSFLSESPGKGVNVGASGSGLNLTLASTSSSAAASTHPLNINEDSSMSVGSEVDRNIMALLSENSVDFTAKFAKLASHVNDSEEQRS